MAAQPVTINVPIIIISTIEFFIKHPVIFYATETATCLWVARLINIKTIAVEHAFDI